jgi:hypothetical protein
MTDIIKTLKQIDKGGVHLPRRALLGGLLGVIAAPAIVKASSLMAVRSMPQTDYLLETATQHYAYGYDHNTFRHSTPDGFKLSRQSIAYFAELIRPGLDKIASDMYVDSNKWQEVFMCK